MSFKDHNADVGSIDTAAASGSPGIFASGSTDTTCRFWDIRQPGSVGCVRMSGGDDVIQVKFFPDGKGVGLAIGGTGAHKGDMVLADMRCLAEVRRGLARWLPTGGVPRACALKAEVRPKKGGVREKGGRSEGFL